MTLALILYFQIQLGVEPEWYRAPEPERDVIVDPPVFCEGWTCVA